MWHVRVRLIIKHKVTDNYMYADPMSADVNSALRRPKLDEHAGAHAAVAHAQRERLNVDLFGQVPMPYICEYVCAAAFTVATMVAGRTVASGVKVICPQTPC